MRELRRLGHRFILMLGGEVAQSAFHFGLNIVLVRNLTPHDYGRFAILFLVGGLALTYVRSLAGVPASIFIPGRNGRRAGRGYEVSFGSAAVILSATMAAGVAASLVFSPDISALAAGLFVGLWALRSYLRLALFAKQRAAASGLGDLVFALSGTGFAVWLIHGGDATSLDGTLTALACANALGILASLALLREPVRISLGRSVRRRYRTLLPTLGWSLVGVTTANVQGQGQSLLVAAIAGPAAYAPIAATFVLFAPLRLSASALINMIQPEIARHLAAGDRARARHFASACAGLLLLGCLAYGGVVLSILPLIETRLFAGRFAQEPMTFIALAGWAIVTVSLIHAPFRVLLETIQAFKLLAALAGISAAVGSAAVVALLLATDPAASLLGVLISEFVVLGGCCIILKPWRREAAGSDPARASCAIAARAG